MTARASCAAIGGQTRPQHSVIMKNRCKWAYIQSAVLRASSAYDGRGWGSAHFNQRDPFVPREMRRKLFHLMPGWTSPI